MKNFKKNINKKRGVALLFAIIVSTILLTVALGAIKISVKELSFSTSAKDTNEALFAADAGAECAIYNDNRGNVFIVSGAETPAPVDCIFDTKKDPSRTSSTNSSSWSFVFSGIGTSGNSCAIVTVTKNTDAVGAVTTKIISKGYDKGDLTNCSGSNRVERIFELNY